MTILVTDVHYRMAVSPLRELGKAGHRIIACELDKYPHPVGFACRYISDTAVLPESSYCASLLALCEKTAKADGALPVLLPMGAGTLRLVCENRAAFEEVSRFLIPEPDALSLLNDKAMLSAFARMHGVPVPKSFGKAADATDCEYFAALPLPCVVKPLCGEQLGLRAAERYRICRTPEELQTAFRHFEALAGQPPVVQEYLEGEALGCSVLCRNGEILASICHRRIREYPTSGGPSSCCEAIDREDLVAYAAKLVEALGFSGLAMFEFKCTSDGQPRLLECNPRVWGTFPLTAAAESNFITLWAQASAGEELDDFITGKPVKMQYLPADFAGIPGYWKAGNRHLVWGAVADVFAAKRGIGSLADPGPGFRYFLNLFGRSRNP